MKKTILFAAVLAALVAAGFWVQRYRSSAVTPRPEPNEKIYVALEGDAEIAVLDASNRTVLRRIDLSVEHDGGIMPFKPHNVQVAPNGASVWVTANAGGHEAHAALAVPVAFAHGNEPAGPEKDEVIVIDPLTDRIIKRIPIAAGVHLAHVTLTPDSAYAYVTAQVEGAVYKINARTHEVVKRIKAREASEPHGIRVAPDSSAAYAAMLAGKSLGILDIKTDAFAEVPLAGAAVQTGVTPDGKLIVVSLYDTKRLAVYRPDTKKTSYVALSTASKGPIQMYPTPDSRYVYLADQGYYFDQPESDLVYKIDLTMMKVAGEIKAGRAPHGVVVSKDGAFVYLTNLLSGDVSVIETATDREVARIAVGREPNGISIWSKESGGTP
ncbi:YncE family protein [Candidatus Parcubacteria bacterium]|nr:YncE family protein [Candidatus Parcubacteria bacterium]